MTYRLLLPVIFLFAGCGGSATSDPPNQSTATLKANAAQALAVGGDSISADPCAVAAWYGDGTCDSFCPVKDTDCVPTGGPVVCAEFSTPIDSKCSRSSGDPCASFQDPDCQSLGPPHSPVAPICAAVACAEISELPDKVCSRPADDCCRFQDPDCATSSAPPVEPICAAVLCAAISEASDKVCSRPKDDCCRSQDPDCQVQPEPTDCAAVACAAYVEEPDNVCSRPETDCCRSQDPDCSAGGGIVACAQYLELSDGTCSRAAGDPCSFQDPDCGTGSGAYNCDLSTIMCKRADPGACPKGEARSIENGCYGQCVAEEKCYPVACALYLEVSDNVCSRPQDDPCKGQDPDCTMSSVPPTK